MTEKSIRLKHAQTQARLNGLRANEDASCLKIQSEPIGPDCYVADAPSQGEQPHELEPVAPFHPPPHAEIPRSRYSTLPMHPIASLLVRVSNNSCTELGRRALLDAYECLTGPGEHGGAAQVEYKFTQEAHVRFVEDKFWFYDSAFGIWVSVKPEVIMRYIAAYEGLKYGEPNKNGTYKSLLMSRSLAKGSLEMAKDLVKVEDFFHDAPIGLVFTDYFYRFDTVKNTFVIDDHAPEHRQRFRYPFESPPQELCHLEVDDPEWHKWCPTFMRLLMNSLPSQRDSWRAIRQRFGLALAGQSHKIRGAHIWLTGPKNNGKSTVARGFSRLFPPDARTTVDVHMAKEYSTGDLAHSRVNVCPEVSEVTSPDLLKQLLTGEETSVRDVGSAAISITPQFFQICCSNGAPAFLRHADSILDRFTVLPVERQPGRANPHLLEWIDHDRRGLVAWALAGFCDYSVNGLCEPEASTRIKAEWVQGSSQPLRWLRECCEAAPNTVLPFNRPNTRDGAFQHYLKWCDETNVAPAKRGDSREFLEAMRSGGIRVKKCGKQNVTSLVGYRLVNVNR